MRHKNQNVVYIKGKFEMNSLWWISSSASYFSGTMNARATFLRLICEMGWAECLPCRVKCEIKWDKISSTCFSSVQSLGRVRLCEPMGCSMPGLPVHHQLPELPQTHVHWVGDAIQPSHPLSSPSSTCNLSQHQGLFQWVSSSHQVARVLEFQLQQQSLQWMFRTDFL